MSKSKLTKMVGKYVLKWNNNNKRLGEIIGKGAFGKVYEGISEKGTFVAIKQVIRKDVSEDQIASIHMEINLLKKLAHPNIVKYIDSISTRNELYIILEKVENGSLSGIVKKYGGLQESIVVLYIRQV